MAYKKIRVFVLHLIIYIGLIISLTYSVIDSVFVLDVDLILLGSSFSSVEGVLSSVSPL